MLSLSNADDSSEDESMPCYIIQDPKLRMDLEHQLKLSRDKVITHYASYRSRICSMVIQKGVSVSEFAYYLRGLPDFVENEHKLDSLPAEADMYDVFQIIDDDFTSYLHYEMFQCILDEYGTDVERNSDKLNKYPEHIRVYIHELDIKHFLMMTIKLPILSYSKKLSLKIDLDLTTKITIVKEFTTHLATILGTGLRPSELKLIDAKIGCLILVFCIPAYKADAIADKTMTAAQIEGLRGLSIHWLKCGDVVVYSNKPANKTGTLIPHTGQAFS